MELGTYLREVWRYVLPVFVVVITATAIAFVATSTIAPTYTAAARLVVTAGLGTDGAGTDDVLAAPRVGQTYAVLGTTRPVLLDVIRRADLPYSPEELASHLTVIADFDTPFMTVSMNDTDGNRAAAAVNALADALVEEASVVSTGGTQGPSLLAIVERAIVPDDPSGPRVLFNTVLAAATALVMALVIVAFATYLRESREPTQGDTIR